MAYVAPGSGMVPDDRADDAPVTGFDRGVDFTTMKDKLCKDYDKLCQDGFNLYKDGKNYEKDKNTIMRKIIYTIIAMIQLRNGSRISEAVNAFGIFLEKDRDLNQKVLVKIAKSKALKTKKNTNEKYITKTRYRKMIFPGEWIGHDIPNADEIRDYLENYDGNLKKRVLDFLHNNYNCNTHSLRYAFINYMLYDQKKEMALVAKFVGHSGVGQLVRYTQAKEADKLFDLDI